MSQKDGKFQSKGKKFGGGFKGRGRHSGGGFGKGFKGDRGERRDFDGEKQFGRRRDFGGKPRFKDRDSREEGSFGPRKPFGKPFKKRFDGDKKPFRKDREFSGERREFREDRPPRRDFGDKPRFKDRDARGGGEGFGARKSFDKPFKKRFDGDKKPFRKDRDFGGARKPFRDDRPQRRDFDDRSERSFSREPSFETKQKLKSDRPNYGAPSSAFLYGVHAVKAAMLNPKRLVQRLLVTEGGYNSIREAYDEAVGEGIKLPSPVFVEKIDIDRLLPRDAVHQDVLLDCQPLEEVFLSDILISAPQDAKVLVLDQVTDPHNIGAILRSASAFGVFAVVVQKVHAPEITGTVAKIASGAVEHVPIAREVNLSRALEQLKEAGFSCLGLDERGKQTLAEAAPRGGKVALVLGAEGDGLRRLVSENCDVLVRLPTSGPIESLNVSNAAAVALYELARGG